LAFGIFRQGQWVMAMRQQRDTIGFGRLCLGLFAVSALGLLAGCGWLFGSSSPSDSQKARPGVDRKGPPTGALPPPGGAGQQHEAGVVAADPSGTPQIGSIVPAKGGQKAQKEAAEKEAAERDAKEREAREKREAEDREAKAKEPKEPEPAKTAGAASPTGGVPSKPAAAERGDASPGGPLKAPPGADTDQPATPAPPPAPVTSTPVAPPASSAPAPAPPSGPPKT
jgi:hypothetical protein